ncbi:MAG: ABC transporter permease [Thermoleophilia bacterium]|nr:ABC transporter permease [Thermoleophilia bacterium]
MSDVALSESRGRGRGLELRKLAAFVRRDFLVAWSYRLSFLSGFLGLIGGAFVFYFVGLMVDPASIPRVDGKQVTYLEFAVVGIALGGFLHLGLERVSAALRDEQMMGTLESLLSTPTTPVTVQVGSVLFDLIFIPVRMAILLTTLALLFGLGLQLDGVPQALVILLFFLPFVWGLGILAAAITLTFRRGSGVVGLAIAGLTLISGLSFPVGLLPGWLTAAAEANPLAIAAEELRHALLGGADWGAVGSDLLLLTPLSLLSFVLGTAAFRLALRRERRLGTLGAY